MYKQLRLNIFYIAKLCAVITSVDEIWARTSFEIRTRYTIIQIIHNLNVRNGFNFIGYAISTTYLHEFKNTVKRFLKIYCDT